MRLWNRGIVLMLSISLLLSLCPPATALGVGGQTPPVPTPAQESPAPAPPDSGALEPGSAPGPGPVEGGPDQTDPPPADPPPEPDWREAATLEELEALLFGGIMQEGGHIRVTGDLLIPAGETCMIWPRLPEGTPLVVDLGEHSLTVEGSLTVRTGIAFTGTGGEAGLIRVRPGGRATLVQVLFTVAEPDGCAVRQDAGGILNYTPHQDTVGEIRLAPPPEAEAASFESLTALLEEGRFLETGGLVRVTADLTLPAGTATTIRPKNPEEAPLTVDLGEHTLTVEGEMTVHSGVAFTGAGGESGLVRVRPGGAAHLSAARFTVTGPEGCALWQEEGGILEYEPVSAAAGSIHFAERAVAVPHAAVSSVLFTPVALVRDGVSLTDALPATDGVRLYRDGRVDMVAQIPVSWDLEPYRARLDSRERVLIAGRYPDADAFQRPVCLVAFENGNPATILNCYGVEGRGSPSAMVQLALRRPELGCRFEWSQDGVTWLPAGAKESPSEGGFPVFHVTFPQGEPPSYPYYLSAVVEGPDGNPGYSDVAVIEEADTQGGNGGNRGGGTDITDPPVPPEPDRDPAPEAPEENGDGGTGGGGSTAPPDDPDHGGGGTEGPTVRPGPDPAPDPKPTPGRSPRPDAPSGGQRGEDLPRPVPTTPSPTPDTAAAPSPTPPARQPEPTATAAAPSGPPDPGQASRPGPPPEPSSAPAAPPQPEPVPETPPPFPEGPGGAEPSGPGPNPPGPSGGGAPPGGPDTGPSPTPSPRSAGVLPIAAGCAAIAATLAAAGCYLYPKAGKRLWEALKRRFKR